MHEKLSQAVKLYDNLLTQQVSRPAWQHASPSYQQQNGYAPQYRPQDPSYGQWSAPQPQQPMSPIQASLPLVNGYVPPPPQEAQPQAMYQPSYQQPQLVTPAQAYSNSPYTQATPASPAPVTIPQYGAASPAPTSAVPYAPSTPAQPSAPPTLSPPQPVSVSAPAPIASPPSAGSAYQSQSALSRSHTVASSAPRLAEHTRPQQAYIARHNTMSHPVEQLQQLQQLSAPPPQLPAFPVVPTGSPQAYAGYNQPIATEPDRKEALLIDL